MCTKVTDRAPSLSRHGRQKGSKVAGKPRWILPVNAVTGSLIHDEGRVLENRTETILVGAQRVSVLVAPRNQRGHRRARKLDAEVRRAQESFECGVPHVCGNLQ